MALTVANVAKNSVGNRYMVTGKITFDSSYPTGGESLTPESVGLQSFDFFQAQQVGGYIIDYDHTTEKLIVYSAGGQGAHTHDLLIKGSAAAGIDEPIGVEGGTSLAKDAATDRTIAGANSATLGGVLASTASIAAASEVANATDLSTLITRFVAFGR